MTPAIMSRFDLFFVVVDECNAFADYNIARHITTLHQMKDQPQVQDTRFSSAQLRNYIKFARSKKPRINPDAAKLLTQYYTVRPCRLPTCLDDGCQ